MHLVFLLGENGILHKYEWLFRAFCIATRAKRRSAHICIQFVPLIYFKMPTVVGTLELSIAINDIVRSSQQENDFISLYFELLLEYRMQIACSDQLRIFLDFEAPLRRNLASGSIPMFPVDKQFLRLPG